MTSGWKSSWVFIPISWETKILLLHDFAGGENGGGTKVGRLAFLKKTLQTFLTVFQDQNLITQKLKFPHIYFNVQHAIGKYYLLFHLSASGEDVRLMLWDTAGQEEFDAITKAYYRGAQACVIAFSTVDRASFDAVKKWKRKVEDECGHIPMVLAQNKVDLMHESQVDR